MKIKELGYPTRKKMRCVSPSPIARMPAPQVDSKHQLKNYFKEHEYISIIFPDSDIGQIILLISVTISVTVSW